MKPRIPSPLDNGFSVVATQRDFSLNNTIVKLKLFTQIFVKFLIKNEIEKRSIANFSR